MSHEVFISHCTNDAEVARAVCSALENEGVKCWIAPRDVQPGENWGRSIIKAISSSRLMVLIFSSQTNASRHVNNEIERAVSHRITILPFRIEKVQPSEDLELFISSCHWLDAYAPPLDAKIAELVAAVRGVVSGQPAAPSAESAATPRAPAGPGPAPAHTASSRKMPRPATAAAAALLLTAVAGGAYYFLRNDAPRRSAPEVRADLPPTSAKAEPASGSAKELAKAKKLEDAQDFVGALDLYSEMLARNTEDKDIRTRAENAIARLEEKAGEQPPGYRLIGILNDLADLQLARAASFLGRLLRTSDPGESVKLFRAAGEQGDRSAMVEAGLMIASGLGNGRPDYEEAAGWFKKASDAGSAEGQRLYADCLLEGLGVQTDEAEAARLYSSAMSLGDVSAKSRLAQLYRSGRGLAAADQATAFRLFTEAAASGFLEAQGNLGVMYMNGETVPADPEKAVSLWKDGAEKGDEICMVFYATALENGAIAPPDLAAAREWYRKAATLRNQRAIEWCVKNGVSF